MNGKTVVLQGGLALLGLAAAYTTWQRQPELQPGEVFVLDITRNDLEKIRFDDEDAKTWAELQRDSDDNGNFVALRLSRREAPATKTAAFDAEAAATPIIRLAVETMASSDPSTAARNHPARPLRCISICFAGMAGFGFMPDPRYAGELMEATRTNFLFTNSWMPMLESSRP